MTFTALGFHLVMVAAFSLGAVVAALSLHLITAFGLHILAALAFVLRAHALRLLASGAVLSMLLRARARRFLFRLRGLHAGRSARFRAAGRRRTGGCSALCACRSRAGSLRIGQASAGDQRHRGDRNHKAITHRILSS